MGLKQVDSGTYVELLTLRGQKSSLGLMRLCLFDPVSVFVLRQKSQIFAHLQFSVRIIESLGQKGTLGGL